MESKENPKSRRTKAKDFIKYIGFMFTACSLIYGSIIYQAAKTTVQKDTRRKE